jgi:hypothetical protein
MRIDKILLCVLVSLSKPVLAVSLHDFRELSAHYGNALQIPPVSNNITIVLAQVAPNLPQTYETSNFSETSVLASSALGAVYCFEFIVKESRLAPDARLIYRDIDFNAPPNAISPIIGAEVIGRFSQLFWGRDITESELVTMTDVSAKIMNELPMVVSSTKLYLRYQCTIMASALDSLIVR